MSSKGSCQAKVPDTFSVLLTPFRSSFSVLHLFGPPPFRSSTFSVLHLFGPPPFRSSAFSVLRFFDTAHIAVTVLQKVGMEGQGIDLFDSGNLLSQVRGEVRSGDIISIGKRQNASGLFHDQQSIGAGDEREIQTVCECEFGKHAFRDPWQGRAGRSGDRGTGPWHTLRSGWRSRFSSLEVLRQAGQQNGRQQSGNPRFQRCQTRWQHQQTV